MDIKRKLSSRKFWAAIAGIVVGVVVSFGGDGDTISSIAGTVMSIISAVTSIIAEATVDKASAGKAVEGSQDETDH